MNREKLHKILASVQRGSLNINDALKQLKDLPYEDVGVAKVDHHRELRHGIPEVIFARGKELFAGKLTPTSPSTLALLLLT